MLNPHVLDGSPAPSAPQGGSDPRLIEAAQLADRGDHEEAALLAEAILEEGGYDIRAVGFYLFGLFLQEGVSALPVLFERLAVLLDQHLDAVGPSKKKPRVIDVALARLFGAVSDRCRYHTTHKDDVWQGWIEAEDEALADASLDLIGPLRAAIGRAVEPEEQPRYADRLARLERWLADELRPAAARAARRRARAAAQATEAEAPGEPTGAERERVEAEPDGAAVAAPGWEEDGGEAPAMRLLRRKLRAFEELVERQDLLKAAVVAGDLRQIIESFDPVVYLPKLFAGYFRVLASTADELMPYWMESESPTWQALEQFYRADLDGFLAD